MEDKMGKIREQFLVDQNGKKTAVVLPIEDYKQLLEDLHDLSVVAERRHEPTISFDELKQRLRADGIIQD
jgi:PHD/YefM family antitoxin component YafN of YafNO toxin-antitoxin module